MVIFCSETGEGLEIMPGSTVVLTQELAPFPHSSWADKDDTTDHDVEWRPQFLIHLIQVSSTTFTNDAMHGTTYGYPQTRWHDVQLQLQHANTVSLAHRISHLYNTTYDTYKFTR